MTIEVIDSKTYTYIYGHIVVKAAEMREQGESFDAIVSVVKAVLTAWKPPRCVQPQVPQEVRPYFGRRGLRG
ncbi:MAG: DegV family protein [Butyricicoccaceae bacterium]